MDANDDIKLENSMYEFAHKLRYSMYPYTVGNTIDMHKDLFYHDD